MISPHYPFLRSTGCVVILLCITENAMHSRITEKQLRCHLLKTKTNNLIRTRRGEITVNGGGGDQREENRETD
jgi:hypothetical protein